MRINPMLNKELKLSVRTPRSSVLLVIFNTVLSLIGIGFVFYMKETSAWNGRIHFRYNIYMYIFSENGQTAVVICQGKEFLIIRG